MFKKLLPYRPQARPPPPEPPPDHPPHAPRRPHLIRRSRKQLQHARPDRNDTPTALIQKSQEEATHHRPHPRKRRRANLPARRLPLLPPTKTQRPLPANQPFTRRPAAKRFRAGDPNRSPRSCHNRGPSACSPPTHFSSPFPPQRRLTPKIDLHGRLHALRRPPTRPHRRAPRGE